MTLSHLQGHSYCSCFKYDFYPRGAMLLLYLLLSGVRSPSVVRSPQVGVLVRWLNVEF